MKTALIIGRRGKIGTSILQRLPATIEVVAEDYGGPIDYCFLACAPGVAGPWIKKFRNTSTQIIDFSGSLKALALAGTPGIVYGWDPLLAGHVAMPGCSAYGLLTALIPLKPWLVGRIVADVKFSKSAMRYESVHQASVKSAMQLVRPLTHHHQQEVSDVLQIPVVMLPTIVDVPRGLSFNLFLEVHGNAREILQQAYAQSAYVKVVDQPSATTEVVDTETVHLFVEQQGVVVIVNGVLDNLCLPFKPWLR